MLRSKMATLGVSVWGLMAAAQGPLKAQSTNPSLDRDSIGTTVSFSSDRFTSFSELNPTVRMVIPAAPFPQQDQDPKSGDLKGSENDRNEIKRPSIAGAKKTPIMIEPLKTPDTQMAGKVPESQVEGRLPSPRPLPVGWDREYELIPITKQWLPTAICHKTLYFEDTMLERHGHERFPSVQPLASGVRFYSTVLIMPYLMTLHPPCDNLYDLGHYRPGSAAPCLIERPPYDRTALGVQLFSTGAFFVAAPLP